MPVARLFHKCTLLYVALCRKKVRKLCLQGWNWYFRSFVRHCGVCTLWQSSAILERKKTFRVPSQQTELFWPLPHCEGFCVFCFSNSKGNGVPWNKKGKNVFLIIAKPNKSTIVFMRRQFVSLFLSYPLQSSERLQHMNQTFRKPKSIALLGYFNSYTMYRHTFSFTFCYFYSRILWHQQVWAPSLQAFGEVQKTPVVRACSGKWLYSLAILIWIFLFLTAVRSSRSCGQKHPCWGRLRHENSWLWLSKEYQGPGILQKNHRCKFFT